ncbi:3-oxoacyl-ACP synthase III family protein [Flammeovirga kamogawensis]|uniref:Beta-ketoacyl-[acyl-carrier-protein] synthase III n=1 Tax=Flammeovirga kamogawensis TaxID=373891 RepID=A0ABX8GXS3_9BACT|nr:beta-ketoacyl-ACP synthase III [Flammeovirga kamogawensis]MBB6462801.1 3-oxoacyl-[acyl-carrier-protein] synthase-3 [Flammeovirga kamogawensis]QWG08413.1 ketoacyl-ACP synthase III [Flammeovirga kamogawensis]TRX66709.1 ketoacyl-ACP synthase III [Flammeovirga kamogawensis]
MKNAKITGLGFYVPENVVTNDDLAQKITTSDEWIRERSGIEQRRYAAPGQANYHLAAEATKEALAMAELEPKDIDMIVYCTLSADYIFPGSGVLLQRELGFKTVPALDIRQQCSGFVYGLSIADQYIKTGMYKNILVVGSEIHSRGLDFSDAGRAVTVLFGDGAGAAILSPTDEDCGILSTHMHSEGEHAEKLAVIDPGFTKEERFDPKYWEPGGSAYPFMDGQFVFKNAVVRFQEVIAEALQANNLKPEDIDLLVPHQANLRISNFVQAKMKLPDDKVINTIQKYGNTTAASIPISLTTAYKEGRIKKGDIICLAAFGSGFTWASAIIKW